MQYFNNTFNFLHNEKNILKKYKFGIEIHFDFFANKLSKKNFKKGKKKIIVNSFFYNERNVLKISLKEFKEILEYKIKYLVRYKIDYVVLGNSFFRKKNYSKKEFKSFFNILNNYLTKNKIKLLVEPIAKKYGTIHLTNPRTTYQFIKKKRNCKLLLDIGNIIENKLSLENQIKIYSKYAEHIHIRDHNLYKFNKKFCVYAFNLIKKNKYYKTYTFEFVEIKKEKQLIYFSFLNKLTKNV